MALPYTLIITSPVHFYPSGFDMLAGLGGPIAGLVTGFGTLNGFNTVFLVIFPKNRPPQIRADVIHFSDVGEQEASYFMEPTEALP